MLLVMQGRQQSVRQERNKEGGRQGEPEEAESWGLGEPAAGSIISPAIMLKAASETHR